MGDVINRRLADVEQRLVATGQKYLAQRVRLAAACSTNIDLETGEAIPLASPIEDLFAMALSLVASDDPGARYWRSQTLADATALLESFLVTGPFNKMAFPQVTMGAYRVDFLVLYAVKGETRKIVVECDGHDFHERTKEQASSDKKRDRILQEMGCKVFRFSGADIWRDPINCAEQVWGSASKAMAIADYPALEHLVAWRAPA